MAEDDDAEQMTDAIQRFVGIATSVARIALRGARFTRIPWVLVASSSVSIGVTVRAGVRELPRRPSVVSISEEVGVHALQGERIDVVEPTSQKFVGDVAAQQALVAFVRRRTHAFPHVAEP